MRLNRYLAQAAGVSRRAADSAITEGRVTVNGKPAVLGLDITAKDTVTLDGVAVSPAPLQTAMVNKPSGVVCSRRQQGNNPTIYSLLPDELTHLKPVGRLDKASSGLLLLTNDGHLAQRLTHPRYRKLKRYRVRLKPQLTAEHRRMVSGHGVQLSDGLSRFTLHAEQDGSWVAELTEGRNRQIRRTFESLGYEIPELDRIELDGLMLGELKRGAWRWLTVRELKHLEDEAQQP